MKSFEAEIETELLTLEGTITLQEKYDSLHESIDEFYEQPLPDYLINDPEVVGYPDAEFQEMIYAKVVSELIGCEDVIDLGCGRGDLYPIVDAFGIQYTGVDRLESMKKVAEQKYTGINFLCQEWYDPLYMTSDAVVVAGSADDLSSFADLLNISLGYAKKKVVMVLSEDIVPIQNVVFKRPHDTPYKIDASFASGVYILTIWKNSFE